MKQDLKARKSLFKTSPYFTSSVQTCPFLPLICECEAPGRICRKSVRPVFSRACPNRTFRKTCRYRYDCIVWTPVWRAWRWMHWCWSPYIQSSPWKPKRNVHTMTRQPASESVALLNWSLFLSKKPSEPALFSRKWHNECLMIQFSTGWLATWL